MNRMKYFPYLVICILLILVSLGGADTGVFRPGTIHPAAPPETLQLGQLVGIWTAEQTVRESDGAWSQKKTHGEWRWYYILDGHAIQDDWMSRDGGEEFHPIGTNIRIYNPSEKKWYMAWIDKNNRTLAVFTAISENGNVVMTGTNAKGRVVRNTFSNITGQSFEWVQEWTGDEGKSWFAVARIECKRKK